MRAAAAYLLSVTAPDDTIYLTEAMTALFRVMRSRRHQAIGSEFLRDGMTPGSANAAGVPHEDATGLTFPDGAIDVIGTFDVLEHIQDYTKALAEFFRCLKPGGRLVITVPFNLASATTVTRVTIDAAGTITHLLPPEIHGDPLDPAGALCFYHFGWDFLSPLTEIGFQDPCLSLFWAAQLGYLGGYQFIIDTCKPARRSPIRVLRTLRRLRRGSMPVA